MSLFPLRFSGYRFPFFLLLLLVFSTVMIGDNSAESLLLASYDTSLIAKLFSLNALFLFLFSLSMISLIDRINRGKLFSSFLIVHGIMLFSVRGLLATGATWIVIPLFSYAYVSKIFLFLLFWTLANDIVDSRKAARDFPKIAAGGTLGAISISFIIPVVVSAISAENLLILWGGLSLLAALFFQPIRKQFGRSFLPASISHGRQESKFKQIGQDIRVIGKDPLLKSMALFYFLLFFVLLNQQYGFYEVLNSRFENAAEISHFLGLFNGSSMIVTFLLQISLSSFVIRRIGSTRAMLILPATFTLIFLFLGVAGATEVASVLFWGTTVGLGLRIALFDSFYSPNFQIFFSSLPKDLRGRGKIALEGVVKPFAMILASLWLSLIMPKLPHALASFILIISSIGMVFLALRMRKQYTNSLTRYLQDFRHSDTSEFTNLFRSRDIIPRIREMLNTEPIDVQCYLVELIAEIDSTIARNELVRLLHEGRKEILPSVITALAPYAEPQLKEKFEEYLNDNDPEIAATAARALAEYEGTEDILLPHLTSPSRIMQFTILELLWWRVTPTQRKSMIEEIIIHLNSSCTNTVLDTLDFCGKIDDPITTDLIPQRFPDFSDPLLENHLNWKRFATALSDLEGPAVFNWILSNSKKCGAHKLQSLVPAIENSIKTGTRVEIILDHIEKGTLPERALLSNGLLMWGRPQKKFEKRIKKLCERELISMSDTETHYSAIVSLPHSSGELLATAIDEELLELHRLTAVALAALLDHRGEIRQITSRINHENNRIRSQALEVLDNVGDRRLNRKVIQHLSLPVPVNSISKREILESLHVLKKSSNHWLSECALFAEIQYRGNNYE